MDTQVVVHDDGWTFKNSRGRSVGRRCEARSKRSGVRCRNGTGHPEIAVCRIHGGAAKQVKVAAQRRVSVLLPKALRALSDSLDSSDKSVRLRAARYTIKFAGITPRNVQTTSRTDKTLKAIEAGPPPPPPNDEIEQLINALVSRDEMPE